MFQLFFDVMMTPLFIFQSNEILRKGFSRVGMVSGPSSHRTSKTALYQWIVFLLSVDIFTSKTKACDRITFPVES